MNAYWSPSPYCFADLIGLTVCTHCDHGFRDFIGFQDYAISTQVIGIAAIGGAFTLNLTDQGWLLVRLWDFFGPSEVALLFPCPRYLLNIPQSLRNEKNYTDSPLMSLR